MLRNDTSPIRSPSSAENRLLQQIIPVLTDLTGEDWSLQSPSEKYSFDRLLSAELTSKENVKAIRDLFRSLGWQEGDEGQFKILGTKTPPTWQFQCRRIDRVMRDVLEKKHKAVLLQRQQDTLQAEQQNARQALQPFLQEMQAMEKRFSGDTLLRHRELWKLMEDSRDAILKKIDQLEHTLITNTDARWQALEKKLEVQHQEWRGWTQAQARWQEQMLKYYEEQNKWFKTQQQDVSQMLSRTLSEELISVREDLEKTLITRLKAEREATINALEANLEKHHDVAEKALQQGLAGLKTEQEKWSENQKRLENFATQLQQQLGELSAYRATQAESEKRIETLLQQLPQQIDDRKALWEKTLPQVVKDALQPMQEMLLQQGEKTHLGQEAILARCQTLLAEQAQQKELLTAMNVLSQSYQFVNHKEKSTSSLLISAVTEFPDYSAYFYQLLVHKAVTYYAVLASIASGEEAATDAWDSAGQLADKATFIADLFSIAIPGLHLAVQGSAYVARRCWDAKQQNLCEKIIHFFSMNDAEAVLTKAAYVLTQRYLPLIKPLTDVAIDRLIDGYLLPRWFDAMAQRYPEVESSSDARVDWLMHALKMQRWKLTIYLETKPKRRDPWTAEGWLLRSGIEIPGESPRHYILKKPYEGTLALRRKMKPHLKYGFRYGVIEEIDARYELLGSEVKPIDLPSALYWETHPLTSLDTLTQYRQSPEAKQDVTRRDEEANTLLHRWVSQQITQAKPRNKELTVYHELSQWLKELEFDAHRTPNLANQWPIDIALHTWRNAADDAEKQDIFSHVIMPLLASLFADHLQDLADFTVSRNFNEHWSQVVFQAPYISPLFTALRRSEVLSLETLLNANISVNALDHEKKHALHYLAEKNNRELFQAWEKGPQAASSRWGFSQRDINEKTPIQLACEHQAIDMLYCFGRLFDWKIEEGLPSQDEWGIEACIIDAFKTPQYEVLQALYQIVPGYFAQAGIDNYKVQYTNIAWTSVPVFRNNIKRQSTPSTPSVVTLLDYLKVTLAQSSTHLAAQRHDKTQEATIKNRYQTWAKLSAETSLNDLLIQLHSALQEEPITTDRLLFDALWNPRREYIQAAKPLTDRLHALSKEMPTKTFQSVQFFGHKRQMSKTMQRDILQQALTELSQAVTLRNVKSF